MAKVMTQMKEELVQISMFSRGSEIMIQVIYRKIYSQDKYTPWYMDSFKEFGSYQKIRRALKELEKKGYVIKQKGYPLSWKRVK